MTDEPTYRALIQRRAELFIALGELPADDTTIRPTVEASINAISRELGECEEAES